MIKFVRALLIAYLGFIIGLFVGFDVGFNDGQVSVVNGTYECQQIQQEWFCSKVIEKEHD